jgi:colicin import membrane protein
MSYAYAIAADEPGGTAPAMLSVLVHFALFTVLVFGLNWQSKHPDPVVAELWSELPAILPPEPKVEPKPEPKPEVKPQPKPEPKVEQKPAKPDIALEREKKLAKKKKEEPPLKFDTTQRIREQLAQEQQALNRTRERQEALKQFAPAAPPAIDAGYADKIRAKIKSNIVLPSELKGNPEVIFDVVQLPTGEVLSARLRKSSGNKAYDDAVERAILKSSPLPRPDRPDQFRRELQLKFRPQE